MKKKQLLVACTLAVLMVGCAGKATNAEQSNESGADIICTSEVTAASIIRMADDGSLCYWVKDNQGDKLMDRSLFPDASDELMASMGLSEGVPSSISIFYFFDDGVKPIVFDAGLGTKMGGVATSKSDLPYEEDLNSVECIFLTHMHADHIGGLLDDVYPKATLYINKAEYDYWITNAAESENQLQRSVVAKYADRLVLFDDGDELPHGVRAIVAPGHTPGHTVFQKSDILIIGDLMHGYALQEKHPEISCNYDTDKALAADSRMKILQYANDNKLTMVGMHMPEPAMLSDKK